MTLAAGTRLGAYEIVAPLGAGGMGEVYRARDTKLSRDVAIKVLPAALAADAERLARFDKEARTASALNHPNVVTIYEIGAVDGTSFIAMELVEGKTLRELLDSGEVPLKKLVALAAQIADGLSRAHAAGIVHRDLKPENLMVKRDGLVKILDFGLAKLVPIGFEGSRGTELRTETRGTEAGTVLGTVGYMSPEQASGEPVDFRTDHFSFGSVLYELITGQRAFHRSTPAQTLSAIIESEPEPLAAVAPRTPANLVRVIERCLSKDPEERYGSTKDLARDLASMLDQTSGIAFSGVEGPGARRVRMSHAAAAVAAAVLAAAALAFFAGQKLQVWRERGAPPPPRSALTFRRGFLTGARFAPDGQTVVYSAAWDGKPSEIFTTRVGSTESRPLGIFPAGILAVSSTGEMAISLGCENRWDPCFGTLARVPLAGGAPREILENVSSADWSPSLGSILYEMATGKWAFHRKTGVDTFSAILNEEPEPIASVNPQAPAPLRWIVERCLTKEPDGRYGTTRDLARELANLRDHVSETGTLGETLVTTALSRSRFRLWTLAALAAVIVAVTGASLFGRRAGTDRYVSPPSFHRLTFRHGQLGNARFTPDGQTIVYSADWEGEKRQI